MKKKYAIIDLLKIFFSIMIVVMHAQQQSGYHPNYFSTGGVICIFVIEIVSRIGVPFFFITSSYFLFKGIKSKEEMKTKVFKYCRRLLILFAAWFVINGAYIIWFKLISADGTVIHRLMVLIRNIVLGNGFPASWYMMASIIDALIILLLTDKKGNSNAAYVIGIIFYIICLTMTFYKFIMPAAVCTLYDMVNHYWGHFYISFPYGLIYFSIGKFIAEKGEPDIKGSVLFGLFILAFVLLVTEVFARVYLVQGAKPESYTTNIMLPTVSALLVMTSLKYDMEYKPKYSNFRKASTIIYCSHGAFMIIILKLINKFIIMPHGVEMILLFLMTMMYSLCLSLIIIKLSKKYKIFRYFY